MKPLHKISSILVQKGFIAEGDRDLYEYGIDILFYTLWSTVVLLLIGIILHCLIPTAIMITFFYILQSSGGGYHAKSHFRCLFGMIAGLLTGLSFQFLEKWAFILWFLLIISFCSLLIIPIVLHPNKNYLNDDIPKFAKRSRTITGILGILAVFIVVFLKLPLYPFSAVFFLAACSRISGMSAYKKQAVS